MRETKKHRTELSPVFLVQSPAVPCALLVLNLHKQVGIYPLVIALPSARLSHPLWCPTPLFRVLAQTSLQASRTQQGLIQPYSNTELKKMQVCRPVRAAF